MLEKMLLNNAAKLFEISEESIKMLPFQSIFIILEKLWERFINFQKFMQLCIREAIILKSIT